MTEKAINDAQFKRLFEKFRKFQLDLEFVQLLGDIKYVSFLVQQGYAKKKQFQAYLKYLEYLRQPQFIVFIRYPQGLSNLQLLQSPQFCGFLEQDILDLQANIQPRGLDIVRNRIQLKGQEIQLYHKTKERMIPQAKRQQIIPQNLTENTAPQMPKTQNN